MFRIGILTCALLLPCAAEEKRTERWYQDQASAHLKGRTEVRVDNGRVDIVTDTHAIEVEFAAKWKNAIGQALWYAVQTNKKPGIVLIIQDDKKDRGHLIRLATTITTNNLPIHLWVWPDDFIRP